jgi:hypothetical protein
MLAVSLGEAAAISVPVGVSRSEGSSIMRVQFPRGEGPGPVVSLAGAQNEYLTFEIYLEGVEPRSLRLRVEGQNPGAPWSFQCHQVVSAPLRGDGNFAPDALLSLSQGAVPGGTGVQVWVTVKIPAGASPGIYPWKLIATDAAGRLQIPLSIQVWRFALPDDLPITILARIHYKDLMSRSGATTQQQQDQLLRALLRNLRDYKINALYSVYPFPVGKLQPGTRVEDFTEYHRSLQYILNDLHYRTFQIPPLPGAKDIGKPGNDFAARARIYFPLFAEYLRRQGWEHRALIKLWDEPKPADYPQVVKAYGEVKALMPGIQTISAGRTPEVELAKAVNVWVMYGKGYEAEKVAAAQKAGQEIWLYANKLHGVNQPPAHQRILGWYLYRYGFGGLLFWGINYWPTDPWKVIAGRQDLFRRGTFFYPDPQGGPPLPTTRLEAIRRGLQDYQYFDLLRQAYQQGRITPTFYKGIQGRLNRFTLDLQRLSPQVTMSELEDVRNQIGQILDRAGQRQPQQKWYGQ